MTEVAVVFRTSVAIVFASFGIAGVVSFDTLPVLARTFRARIVVGCAICSHCQVFAFALLIFVASTVLFALLRTAAARSPLALAGAGVARAFADALAIAGLLAIRTWLAWVVFGDTSSVTSHFRRRITGRTILAIDNASAVTYFISFVTAAISSVGADTVAAPLRITANRTGISRSNTIAVARFLPRAAVDARLILSDTPPITGFLVPFAAPAAVIVVRGLRDTGAVALNFVDPAIRAGCVFIDAAAITGFSVGTAVGASVRKHALSAASDKTGLAYRTSLTRRKTLTVTRYFTRITTVTLGPMSQAAPLAWHEVAAAVQATILFGHTHAIAGFLVFRRIAGNAGILVRDATAVARLLVLIANGAAAAIFGSARAVT
ncbi:MAG: hypothetical protein WCU74_04585 [Candidatus Omnitrophota bacterium]